MSNGAARAPEGGLIDRSRSLSFKFDGKDYTGHPGDTLASALLANGIHIVGRSFKYHRPRGIFTAGVEEPNALVQLRTGERTEPNIRATQIELFDGLEAQSQNRWPSLGFDVGAINNRLSKLFPAGFYYKTFMWPANWWERYEHVIRRAAGLGESPTVPDPDRYEKRFAHCDVLIVGAGPAGLCAALAASRSGARVMLVDNQPGPGGSLRGTNDTLDGAAAMDWVASVHAELESAQNVRLLSRTTAFGYYDDNLVIAYEQVADHVRKPADGLPRQRAWWIRAREVVIAAGSIERPIVFGGNDVPGVMLASAARTYANQFGVRVGSKAVVFTNNDSAYDTARALHEAGTTITAIVDSRRSGPGENAASLVKGLSEQQLNGYVVTTTRGSSHVSGVEIGRLSEDGSAVTGDDGAIECDVVCISGGWNPTVHLHSQAQGAIRFDPELTTFVPGESRQRERVAGAANGDFGLNACLTGGAEAGAQAAAASGHPRISVQTPVTEFENTAPLEAVWEVPRGSADKGKRFVDLQNDVTAADVHLAAREGFSHVEHLKRYTTLGMGTDQGRTSNVNGLAILGGLLGKEIPEVGTTTFRPPFSPVTLGTVAGREIDHDFAPLRRTPMHDWHLANGATMVNVGLWQRAQYYQSSSETMWDAIWREARLVRNSVGLVDVSTLGKIEIRGRDAAEFLHRIYINKFQKLAVGKIRYGFLLREDGHVMDDGTTTRVGENEFYMTTTTANAGPVMAHLEFYAQTVWPELQVHLTSITDQWAGMALAGPQAREVLARAVDGIDVGNDSLPFMGYLETTVNAMPVRIFRMTFSGEMAYEIHTPSDFGVAVWEAVLQAGADFDIAPYGTEAMSILRIEKGHVVGAELDGRTLATDFGFGGMMKDDDFVGRRSVERPGLTENRKTFVGLTSDNGKAIPRGAQIVADPDAPTPMKMLGHVTSVCYSPNLEQEIALALIEDGDERHGDVLYASSPLVDTSVPVRLGSPVFIDPKGERARG